MWNWWNQLLARQNSRRDCWGEVRGRARKLVKLEIILGISFWGHPRPKLPGFAQLNFLQLLGQTVRIPTQRVLVANCVILIPLRYIPDMAASRRVIIFVINYANRLRN
jgi:hypothetical protein